MASLKCILHVGKLSRGQGGIGRKLSALLGTGKLLGQTTPVQMRQALLEPQRTKHVGEKSLRAAFKLAGR